MYSIKCNSNLSIPKQNTFTHINLDYAKISWKDAGDFCHTLNMEKYQSTSLLFVTIIALLGIKEVGIPVD